MRVSPVGLFCWNNHARLREGVRTSSIITHSHPLGIEGATLQAMAVALAVAQDTNEPLDAPSFISHLLDVATEDVYRAKIASFASLLECSDDRQNVVDQLGHGIESFNSVPTAIFCFLSHARDFASTVTYAVSLGGDTDTIASMAGAISGAYLWYQCSSQRLARETGEPGLHIAACRCFVAGGGSWRAQIDTAL